MIILKPYTKYTVWGGQRLKTFYGADQSVDKIGSLYTVASLEAYSNEIEYADGYEEKNLFDLFNAHAVDFGYTDFPFLIAFVDAAENLSIQVHPTDEMATSLGLKSGKSESWYFMTPPTNAAIYNGSQTSNLEEFKATVTGDNFSEVVDTLPIKKDDYVYIEAGTIHALTAGSFVYEIQQPTDVTYRFYDYNRLENDGKPRQLQEDEALAVVDIHKKSEAVPFIENQKQKHAPYSVTFLSGSDYYENKTDFTQCFTIYSEKLIVNQKPVHLGQTILVFPHEILVIEGDYRAILAEV